MTRWIVVGVAPFLAGVAFGVLINQPTILAAVRAGTEPSRTASYSTERPADGRAPAAAAAETGPASVRRAGPSVPEARTGGGDVVLVPRSVTQRSSTATERSESAPEQTFAVRGAEAARGAERPHRVPSRPIRMAEPAHVSQALRSNPVVMRELARDIQLALYRAGCHSVIPSGEWDARTAKAAAAFAAYQNAALPTDTPDVVLLSLLRNYSGDACGRVPGAPTAAITASHPGHPETSDLASQAAVIALPREPRRVENRKPKEAPASATGSKKQLSWRRQIFSGNGTN